MNFMKKLFLITAILFAFGIVVAKAQTIPADAKPVPDAKIEYVGDSNVKATEQDAKTDKQEETTAKSTDSKKGKGCCAKKGSAKSCKGKGKSTETKACAKHAKKCSGKDIKACKKACKEHKKTTGKTCSHKH